MTQKPMWLIPAIYVTIRFILSDLLESLGTYAPELFDLATVALVMGGLKLRPVIAWPKRTTLFHSALALSSGYLVCSVASVSSIAVPFDVRSVETLVFLLLIGPVLEEFVFRHALWVSFEKWPFIACAATTLLFSYAHFHAWFAIDHLYRPFVLYQTFYTFALGAILGLTRLRTGGITAPILMHAGFNLGFTIAANTLL